jgi:ABC-type glutathione transport system ATPase component
MTQEEVRVSQDRIGVLIGKSGAGKTTLSRIIAGIMEHIEEAGIHSGDSACVTPPYSLSDELIEGLKRNTYAYVGIGLGVVALLVAIFALLRKK